MIRKWVYQPNNTPIAATGQAFWHAMLGASLIKQDAYNQPWSHHNGRVHAAHTGTTSGVPGSGSRRGLCCWATSSRLEDVAYLPNTQKQTEN